MVLISSLERLGGLGCLRRGRSVISFCVFSKYSSSLGFNYIQWYCRYVLPPVQVLRMNIIKTTHCLPE